MMTVSEAFVDEHLNSVNCFLCNRRAERWLTRGPCATVVVSGEEERNAGTARPLWDSRKSRVSLRQDGRRGVQVQCLFTCTRDLACRAVGSLHRKIGTPSYTTFLGPLRVFTPNGMWIRSVIFAQHTRGTDWQTRDDHRNSLHRMY